MRVIVAVTLQGDHPKYQALSEICPRLSLQNFDNSHVYISLRVRWRITIFSHYQKYLHDSWILMIFHLKQPEIAQFKLEISL